VAHFLIVMLNVIMLSVTFSDCYAERHYAECNGVLFKGTPLMQFVAFLCNIQSYIFSKHSSLTFKSGSFSNNILRGDYAKCRYDEYNGVHLEGGSTRVHYGLSSNHHTKFFTKRSSLTFKRRSFSNNCFRR
jgi:hypothetical protein